MIQETDDGTSIETVDFGVAVALVLIVVIVLCMKMGIGGKK